MTAVAPRPVVPASPSATTVPTTAPRPADRSDATGGRDFAAVLRGHGDTDAGAPRPRPQERAERVVDPRRSSPDHADRPADSSSATVAAPADQARPTPDPVVDGTGVAGVPAAPAATGVVPGGPSPAAGVPATRDGTVHGASARGPVNPSAATAAPVEPEATSDPVVAATPSPGVAAATASPVVARATTAGGQALASRHHPDARTPEPAGGTVPGDADIPAGASGGPTAATAAGRPAGDGVTAPVTSPGSEPVAVSPGGAAAAPATPAGPTAFAMGTVPAAPATGPATAPAAADARPAQPALPPQAQVLNAVSPLLTTADGTHRLTVHLAPAHLGSVQVHLEVRGGEVTVRLTAVDPATGDALRQGTPELRAHLERTGLRSAGIDVQVAPGDPARDPAAGGAATADRGSREQDPRDPLPWTGPDGSGGDTSRDGTWQRHGRPLEGWTPRAAGPRPAPDTPGAPDQPDPHRPRPRDVRVDVRM